MTLPAKHLQNKVFLYTGKFGKFIAPPTFAVDNAAPRKLIVNSLHRRRCRRARRGLATHFICDGPIQVLHLGFIE